MDDILKRLAEAFPEGAELTNKIASVGSPEPSQGPSDAEKVISPIDYYNDAHRASQSAYRAFTSVGSNAMLIKQLNVILPDLKMAYKKATDDYEYLRGHGDKSRAEAVKGQYTEDKFLPAIEALLNFTTADELINADKVIDELDKYAVIGGSGEGYSRAFISQIHNEERGVELDSDNYVKHCLNKISMLVSDDRITAASGVARRLMEQIEAGENRASKEDYDLIRRVAMRG